MAEEQQELRRINWKEIFSFWHIFKSFRMAIQPSKLLLALAAIVLVFVMGNVMDWFWALGRQYVAPDEIQAHFLLPGDTFKAKRQVWKDSRISEAAKLLADAKRNAHDVRNYTPAGAYLSGAFGEKLAAYNKDNEAGFKDVSAGEVEETAVKEGTSWKQLLASAGEQMDHEAKKIKKLLGQAEDAAEEQISKLSSGTDKEKDAKNKAKQDLPRHVALSRQALTQVQIKFADSVRAIRGEGIYDAFMDYQWRCVRNAIGAVAHGNFLGEMGNYHAVRAASASLAGGEPESMPAQERIGFVYWVLLAFHAVVWLICQFPTYALIFLVLSLAIVALFGGAVNRIAAIHFARDDKISMVQALKFSASRFGSLFICPLLPLAIIFFLGLCLTLGGLLANIPYLGELLLSLVFFLTLLAGLAAAFVVVGLVAGGALMYPTIAVEGSDSFDAMSRSFSYVYNRPWRALGYGLVALVYGAMTYLFVRTFVWLALAATHCFLKWGAIGQGQALGPRADKIDILWTAPTFDRLFGPFTWAAMNRTEQVAAFIMGIWVFLAAAMVAAFLLSFAASSTTVIYYLLRRKVDATDLDDVYMEEAEDEMPATTEPAPAGEGPKPPQDQPKA